MPNINIDLARVHAQEIGNGGTGLTGGPQGPPTGLTPISLNTPDILNSIISINPFFDSNTPTSTQSQPTDPFNPGGIGGAVPPGSTPDEPEKKVFAMLETPEASPQTTVQSMRSQLIKEGLKLTIQSKRKSSGKGEINVKSELEVKRRKDELTPEDEERRRRRRERNKIAATKCRNKKKEKTCLLVQESESLEGNNVSLKSEISKLESERQRLLEVLAAHAPICKQNMNNSYNDYNHNHNHSHHHNHNHTNYYDQAIQL